MKNLLERKMAPMEKLLLLAQNRTVLAKELVAFQEKNGLRSKMAGQD